MEKNIPPYLTPRAMRKVTFKEMVKATEETKKKAVTVRSGNAPE
jgi:hypothetical protein